MSFWVYMLRCADGSYYVGHTENLESRVWEHNDGRIGGYTVSRLPVKLAFSQDHATCEEALASERLIKGWKRVKKEALIRGDWIEISRLAKSKTSGPEPRPSTGSGRTEEEK